MSRTGNKVRVKLRRTVDDSYDLVVGSALMERLAADLRRAPLGDRYVVISDSTVMKLHGNELTECLRKAGLKVDRIGFPEGESSKSRKMKQYLEEHMLGLGLGRDCCVIACGGGVTGDLAGFTASTYLRGVPVVMYPTTLLSMVDSSIGGKTAIDVPEGKNLLGTFHQPRAVYIDVSMLETLPRRHLLSGMAEVVKHGIIKDREFVKVLEDRGMDLIDGDPDAQKEIILESCRIKSEVVSADEKELDYRRILNYGHTLGHAVEAASNYSLYHGEAISLGMAMEAGLAESLEILPAKERERQDALLKKLGLPVKAKVVLKALLGRAVRPQDILSYVHQDKKTREGITEYVLPVRLGQMKRYKKKVGVPVDDKTTLKLLKRFFN
ncbi:MAG: 3-dehydroquinate synthase [bacterium]